MRICVLYRTTEGPWGGGNSFLRSVKKSWKRRGIEVVGQVRGDVDGVLLNSSFLGAGAGGSLSEATARRLVRTGYRSRLAAVFCRTRWRTNRPPFVHRLDGVFRLYGRRLHDPEDAAQLSINRHVDWTIYQSRYCRESFALEGAEVERSSIVYNGVDLDRFRPAESPPDAPVLRLVAAAWSPNPRKGAALLAEFSTLRRVEVTFLGNWPPSIDPGGVRVLPAQRHEMLAPLLRQHHGFLHMAENDPCSNAVLEGMASGLPVIFHPSGGTPEVVGDCGIEYKASAGRAVEEFADRLPSLRTKVLERRLELSVDRAADAYLEVFERLGRIAAA